MQAINNWEYCSKWGVVIQNALYFMINFPIGLKLLKNNQPINNNLKMQVMKWYMIPFFMIMCIKISLEGDNQNCYL